MLSLYKFACYVSGANFFLSEGTWGAGKNWRKMYHYPSVSRLIKINLKCNGEDLQIIFYGFMSIDFKSNDPWEQ